MPINNNESRTIYDFNTSSENIDMFALDNEKQYNSLDSCIDDSRESDLFAILQLIRGQQPQKKRQKRKHLKPIVAVRFNFEPMGGLHPFSSSRVYTETSVWPIDTKESKSAPRTSTAPSHSTIP